MTPEESVITVIPLFPRIPASSTALVATVDLFKSSSQGSPFAPGALFVPEDPFAPVDQGESVKTLIFCVTSLHKECHQSKCSNFGENYCQECKQNILPAAPVIPVTTSNPGAPIAPAGPIGPDSPNDNPSANGSQVDWELQLLQLIQ